jgi:hypothetical protein
MCCVVREGQIMQKKKVPVSRSMVCLVYILKIKSERGYWEAEDKKRPLYFPSVFQQNSPPQNLEFMLAISVDTKTLGRYDHLLEPTPKPKPSSVSQQQWRLTLNYEHACGSSKVSG